MEGGVFFEGVWSLVKKVTAILISESGEGYLIFGESEGVGVDRSALSENWKWPAKSLKRKAQKSRGAAEKNELGEKHLFFLGFGRKCYREVGFLKFELKRVTRGQ